MSAIFKRPFLADRFDSRGGGIDFLGMRQVNLAMLQDELIPGINNGTADLGTFCLGAWIPWKFRQLCQNADDFVVSKYSAFREAMEVAMAYTTRDHSPANEQFGRPRTRMGVQHQPPLPGLLTFKAAQRTKATSLYAAPLYGPTLRYLGLLQATDAVAKDGTSTRIPLAGDDRWTDEIVRYVEARLTTSPHFSTVVQLKTPSVSGETLDDLGLHGLHPSSFRKAPSALKRAFLHRLFSDDSDGGRRLLTAALICRTVKQQEISDEESLRRVWYTGLLDSGDPLVLEQPSVRDQRVRWAVFQARQIQRTIVELFLRCFELGLSAGCRTVDQVIGYWRDCSPEAERMLAGKAEDLVRAEARVVYKGADFVEASRTWNAKIHGGHKQYDDLPWSDDDAELARSLKMLARWWVRMSAWIEDEVWPTSAEASQRERLPMGWFHQWVGQRLQFPLGDVLHDLFSDLVFAQHVKVALIRFDGQVQRLRFTLGDEGIVPTAEVGDKLGEHPVRMADRLFSFIGILCDVGILRWQDDRLAIGSHPFPTKAGGVADLTGKGRQGSPDSL